MFISDIMSRCVGQCTEDMRLDEVFQLIRECDYGFVIVVDSLAHRVPLGVVSERSICEQIIVRGRNPRNLSAGSVMDSRIRRVLETDLVESIGETYSEDEFAAIVVVDDTRQVRGLVTREKIRRIAASVTDSHVPAPVAVSAVQGRARRTREIPAFGWVQ